jgi:hypothetical protein
LRPAATPAARNPRGAVTLTGTPPLRSSRASPPARASR